MSDDENRGTTPEPLPQTLERTGFRASLSSAYTEGHAPAVQHRDEPSPPPAPASYYGLPAIKRADWEWYVPAYFFVGGTAAGSFIVATLVDIFGREEDRPYVLAGRTLALLGMLISPILLVADLGRPERFLNMLRIFKPRSMMNMGSWALTLFGGFVGLAAAAEVLQVLGPRVGLFRFLAAPLRVVSWLGVGPALYVGSYTGLLLSATNVPLWAGNRLFMGPLVLSSAMSSGLAATGLVGRLLGRGRPARGEPLLQAEQVALTTELVMTAASALALRGLARPLLVGRWARRYQVGSLGTGLLLPLAMHRLGLRHGFWGILASLLVLVGSAVLRFAVTEAGKESADDPSAYFSYTAARGRE